MKIGIVGIGVVGSACKFGFELIGHEVLVHDIKLKTSLKDLVNCEIIFLCVPTPNPGLKKFFSCFFVFHQSVQKEDKKK